MPIYIIPALSSDRDSQQVRDLAKRARVPLVEPDKLFEIYTAFPASIVLLSLSDHSLNALTSNVDELLPEAPTAIFNVPGALYSHSWTLLSQKFALYPVDWKEIEVKLLKSGTLGTTADAVASSMSRSNRGTDSKLELREGTRPTNPSLPAGHTGVPSNGDDDDFDSEEEASS